MYGMYGTMDYERCLECFEPLHESEHMYCDTCITAAKPPYRVNIGPEIPKHIKKPTVRLQEQGDVVFNMSLD